MDVSKYAKLCEENEKDEDALQEVAVGKRIGFYKIQQQLGSGAFAKVKLGSHFLVGAKVAMKIVNKNADTMDAQTLALLNQEIECMSSLAHPNIVRLFEVIETPSHFYIVSEFAPSGDLTDKIEKYKKLSEKMAKNHFAQILSAVNYIHEKNIIHRDIKSDNILINGDVCKLADFGFCTVSSKEKLLQTFCGSPPFAAPELFKDDHYSGRCVDIWALGVVLYYMTIGTLPFVGGTVGKLKQLILTGNYAPFPEHVSDSLKFLISNILKVYPQDRLTTVEMMRSKWLEDETFTKPLSSIRLKPPCPGEEMDKVEGAAFQEMKNFGIKDKLIRECPNDLRNRISGTYRVAYYHAERAELRKQHKMEEAKRERRAAKLAADNKKDNPLSKMCSLI